MYQAEPSAVPCDWTRTLSPPSPDHRSSSFSERWAQQTFGQQRRIRVPQRRKKKKIIFPLPPISGTGQKKFSGIASSGATAAARLCCWYFWGFAPKWVREIRVTHKSEVQRLAGGWVSAGLFYCLFESAGKALLRIKPKSDLGSSGDGKSWTKLRAVSVPALVALD